MTFRRDNLPEQPGARILQAVAVIGAGPRGRAFALRCAEAGCNVVLEDVLSAKLRKAEAQLAGASASLKGKLSFAVTVEEAVREADVAIDFVPDELESKLEIFSMLDRMAPPRTILCTPTDLSITDLASCTYRADRCIGLHSLQEELEGDAALVRGQSTSEETTTSVRTWLERLRIQTQIISEVMGHLPHLG